MQRNLGLAKGQEVFLFGNGTSKSQKSFRLQEKDGVVVAYAYATSHRSRGAYRWSCEVSVYVGEKARRLGAARRLYQHLFKTLAELGHADVLAAIVEGVAAPR